MPARWTTYVLLEEILAEGKHRYTLYGGGNFASGLNKVGKRYQNLVSKNCGTSEEIYSDGKLVARLITISSVLGRSATVSWSTNDES